MGDIFIQASFTELQKLCLSVRDRSVTDQQAAMKIHAFAIKHIVSIRKVPAKKPRQSKSDGKQNGEGSANGVAKKTRKRRKTKDAVAEEGPVLVQEESSHVESPEADNMVDAASSLAELVRNAEEESKS